MHVKKKNNTQWFRSEKSRPTKQTHLKTKSEWFRSIHALSENKWEFRPSYDMADCAKKTEKEKKQWFGLMFLLFGLKFNNLEKLASF